MTAFARLLFRGCLLAAAAGFLTAPALPAAEAPGPARLAADFEPGTFPVYRSISDFARVGNRAVFLQADSEHSPALWVTDGTRRGTMLLAVLCPPCSSGWLLGSTGSVAFYGVGSGYPSEVWIWRTDGTPAGTFPIKTVFREPSPPSSGFLGAVAGGRLFFTACTPEQGCEPWSSDGTVAGTAPVGETVPGPESRPIFSLVASGEKAFLIAGTPGDGKALWVADGSGLRYLRETPQAAAFTPAVSAGNGRVFFIAQDVGLEVWTSDGTRAGTRPLTSFGPRDPFGYNPTLKVLDGRAYFRANDGAHGFELWSLGRRETSLLRLTDFSHPATAAYGIEKAGDRIVFLAVQDYEQRLWSSLGDFRSTAPVTGCPGGCPAAESLLADGGRGRLMFYGRDQTGGGFWVTDGTGAGTRLVQRPDREHELVQVTAVGGRFLFELTEEYEGGELWVSNGSTAGTFRAGYGGPGWSHYYGWAGSLQAGTAGGLLVFPAAQTAGFGEALWISDGSPAGSRPIHRFLMGKGSEPRELVPFQDGLLVQDCAGGQGELNFVRGIRGIHGTGAATEVTRLLALSLESCTDFFATNPIDLGATAVFLVFRGSGEESRIALWGTDGAPGGTAALIEAASQDEPPQELTRFGEQAAFWRAVKLPDGRFQFGLWATDGTRMGTRKLLDLPAGIEAYNFTGIGGRLYFADVEPQGDHFDWQVWVSDGTPEGTRPLTTLKGLNLENSGVQTFAGMGGRVFFRMSQGGGPFEIWSTDGTPAGTGPAVRAAAGIIEPEPLAPLGDRLYFAARREGDPSGRLLPWVSDGTTAGTVPLVPAPAADAPGFQLEGGYYDFPRFTELAGRVFFTASDADHGSELWATDGTPEGTARVRDIQPGAFGSYPSGLTSWNGRLWFSALDPLGGMELWSTDGSAQGTRLVQDVAVGPSWSTPTELTPAGQDFYFSAHDGIHGRELWVLPAEAFDPDP